jgi:hypothetical protein
MVVFRDVGEVDVSKANGWSFFGELRWDMVLEIAIVLTTCE